MRERGSEWIPVFQPAVSPGARQAVMGCLESGWLGEGEAVREFEARLCSDFEFPRAAAVSSGTAALHLAMLAAGVGEGDEVITTALTFVATGMAPLYVGATPVFADVQPRGPNIDPADVERRVTARSKAIIAVHYGGYPCDMDELRDVADRHGLSLIEDAAHALGARYRGRPVGTLGDCAAFSFQAIKLLTTGDGGLLVCSDAAADLESRRRRWFGIDKALRRPSEVGEPGWDITDVGYKYSMNDIAATLGLAELEHFPERQARRRHLDALYRNSLGRIDGLRLLSVRSDRESACWLFTVRVERREDFVRAIRSRGVEAAVWHRRIDTHSLFGGLRDDLPNLAAFDESQVSIPMRETLSDSEVETVLGAVRSGW